MGPRAFMKMFRLFRLFRPHNLASGCLLTPGQREGHGCQSNVILRDAAKRAPPLTLLQTSKNPKPQTSLKSQQPVVILLLVQEAALLFLLSTLCPAPCVLLDPMQAPQQSAAHGRDVLGFRV